MKKIALIQSFLVWGDEEQNLRNFDKKLIKPLGSDIILLPEMFISGSMMVKKDKSVADTLKKKTASYFDKTVEMMQGWALRQDALIMGSTVYEEHAKYYNRLVVAFPDGQCLYYDKRHCFRMGGENEYFTAGNSRLVFDFRDIKIAAFICYDLRFPVWSRNTEVYDLAVYVANWPESRRDVWRTLLRARAIENQAFVAGVNCVGTDDNGLKYAGDSMLVNARGEVVIAGEDFKEQIIVADINTDELHEFRRKFSVLEDGDSFTIN